MDTMGGSSAGFRQFVKSIDDLKKDIEQAGSKEVELLGRTLTVKLIKGEFAFRDSQCCNDYNQEGITLDLIDLEVLDITKDLLRTDWNALNIWLGGLQCGYDGIKNNESTWKFKLAFRNYLQSHISKHINDPLLKRKDGVSHDYSVTSTKKQDDSVLLRTYIVPTTDYDQELIELIKELPESLLACPIVQDWWARWSFASNWGFRQDVRDAASGFLNELHPLVGRGPKKKTKIRREQIYIAYEDCKTYVASLKKCINGTQKDKEMIISLFPSSCRLNKSYFDLDKICNEGYQLPTPSDVAAAYIGQLCGIESKTVLNIVVKQNKNK